MNNSHNHITGADSVLDKPDEEKNIVEVLLTEVHDDSLIDDITPIPKISGLGSTNIAEEAGQQQKNKEESQKAVVTSADYVNIDSDDSDSNNSMSYMDNVEETWEKIRRQLEPDSTSEEFLRDNPEEEEGEENSSSLNNNIRRNSKDGSNSSNLNNNYDNKNLTGNKAFYNKLFAAIRENKNEHFDPITEVGSEKELYNNENDKMRTSEEERKIIEEEELAQEKNKKLKFYTNAKNYTTYNQSLLPAVKKGDSSNNKAEVSTTNCVDSKKCNAKSPSSAFTDWTANLKKSDDSIVSSNAPNGIEENVENYEENDIPFISIEREKDRDNTQSANLGAISKKNSNDDCSDKLEELEVKDEKDNYNAQQISQFEDKRSHKNENTVVSSGLLQPTITIAGDENYRHNQQDEDDKEDSGRKYEKDHTSGPSTHHNTSLITSNETDAEVCTKSRKGGFEKHDHNLNPFVQTHGLDLKMKPISFDTSPSIFKYFNNNLNVKASATTSKVLLTHPFLIKLISINCYHILDSYSSTELLGTILKNTYYVIESEDRCYKLPKNSTPLHIAAILGKPDCVRVILNKIMHLTPKELLEYPHYDNDGHTAMMKSILSACKTYVAFNLHLDENMATGSDTTKNFSTATANAPPEVEDPELVEGHKKVKGILEKLTETFSSVVKSNNDNQKNNTDNNNGSKKINYNGWIQCCKLLRDFEGGMRTVNGVTSIMLLLKFYAETVSLMPSLIECSSHDSCDFVNYIKSLFSILAPVEAGIGFYNPIPVSYDITKSIDIIEPKIVDVHTEDEITANDAISNGNSRDNNQSNDSLSPDALMTELNPQTEYENEGDSSFVSQKLKDSSLPAGSSAIEKLKDPKTVGLFANLKSFSNNNQQQPKFLVLELDDRDTFLYSICYTALHFAAISGFGFLKTKGYILNQSRKKQFFDNSFYDYNVDQDHLYKEAEFTNGMMALIQREATITSFFNSYSPLMLFAMSRVVCKYAIQQLPQYLNNAKDLLDVKTSSYYLMHMDAETNEMFDYLLEANAGLTSSVQWSSSDKIAAPSSETATMIASRVNNPLFVYGLYRYCIIHKINDVYAKELKVHDQSSDSLTALMKAIYTHNVCVPPLSVLESRETNNEGKSSLYLSIELYHNCLTFLGILKQQGVGSDDSSISESIMDKNENINDPDLISSERDDEDFFEMVQNYGSEEAIRLKLLDNMQEKKKYNRYVISTYGLPMDNIFGRPMTIRSILKRQSRVRALLTSCQYNIRTLIQFESKIQTKNDKKSALMLTCQLGYVIYSHMLVGEKGLVDKNNCTALVYTYQSYYNYRKELAEMEGKEEESDKAIRNHFETLIDELKTEMDVESFSSLHFKEPWSWTF